MLVPAFKTHTDEINVTGMKACSPLSSHKHTHPVKSFACTHTHTQNLPTGLPIHVPALTASVPGPNTNRHAHPHTIIHTQ